MTDPEHKLLAEKIDILQKTIDRFYEDFIEDRRARGEMEITLKGVATKTDATREDLSDNNRETKRIIQDGIEDAVKPIKRKLEKLVASKDTVVHYIKDERKRKFRVKFWKKER